MDKHIFKYLSSVTPNLQSRYIAERPDVARDLRTFSTLFSLKLLAALALIVTGIVIKLGFILIKDYRVMKYV